MFLLLLVEFITPVVNAGWGEVGGGGGGRRCSENSLHSRKAQSRTATICSEVSIAYSTHTHLVKKFSFMELKGWLTCSQKPKIGQYDG
jgi:hypothetical protein